jgi:thiamine-phosphate pyrophosphorylase
VKPRVAGLYAVTPDTPDTAALAAMVEAALAGGARLVQYRNKSAAPELRLEQARALKRLCARAGAPFLVNDHLELALAVDADGLHLGGGDGPLAEARARLGPGRLLGASCYNRLELAHAAAAAGADYIAFGSFFASRVKPGAVAAPLALLAEARRALALPVVAIGGITLDNAPSLIRAGAQALAVISALFAARDVAHAARQFDRLFGGDP